MNPNDNRVAGSEFEIIFIRRASSNGLLALKNHLTCRFTFNGRMQVIPGELDFKLISSAGVVGFFDCKAYESDHFTYSHIDPRQVERAVTYNNWRVPAGFVVWFKPENTISFFTGHMIARKGPRNSFNSREGYPLGNIQNFDLKPVLKPRKGRPVLFELTAQPETVGPNKSGSKHK